MEGENHPRNHQRKRERERERERESHRVVFCACYFLVLSGGEARGGRLFRAHARLSLVSHRENADKGQRNRPFVVSYFGNHRPRQRTARMSTCPISFLI